MSGDRQATGGETANGTAEDGDAGHGTQRAANGKTNGKVAPAKSDEETKMEQELERLAVIPSPDGGLKGWLVVAGGFFGNLCVDGVIYTSGGVMIPMLQATYKIGESAAAACFSLMAFFYFISAPAASALSNNFGGRIVACAGSLIAALAFLFSIAISNIYVLWMLYSVAGIGFGLIFLPSIILVSQYFEKKRSLATGIAVSGSGIGTIILNEGNSVVNRFIAQGSVRIMFVYYAIVSFCSIVCGILLNPLEPSEEQVEKVKEIAMNYEGDRIRSLSALSQNLIQPETKQTTAVAPAPVTNLGATLAVTNENPVGNRPFLSVLELNVKKTEEKKIVSPMSQVDIVTAVSRDTIKDLNRPFTRPDLYYPGSMHGLAVRSRSSTMASNTVKLIPKVDRTEEEEAIPEECIFYSTLALPAAEQADEGFKRKFFKMLSEVIDFRMLTLPSCVLVFLSGLLSLTCFYVPFTFLQFYIDQLEGVTPQMKTLPISILGFVNIVSRIVVGKICDLESVNEMTVSAISISLAGLTTIAVPFYPAYIWFLVYCGVFAVGVACVASLRTAIFARLFGVNNLTYTFPMSMAFMGVGGLLGSPLATTLKSLTGNYDLSFYVAGSLMAISGVILHPAILGPIRRREQKQEEAQQEQEMKLLKK